jgi:selenocysteine-specific elongation factor
MKRSNTQQLSNIHHIEHIIIGTAGHIDHGKTSLVRTLTGIDTDRLPEEKRRGLTIDLGFAYLDLDSNRRISIVDVPGHERFVKNMLAGATSINLVLFVVAADDGVMPQTVEHLEIINLLGIRHGIVVLTKRDLVTDEWLAVVQEDIKNILAGTSLEHAPIIPVSTVTGEGIESCKAAIKGLVAKIKTQGSIRVFRLPVDRSFTISGYGCVVTGPVLGGQISVEDEVEILPIKKILRIRGIEITGERVNTAFSGQRAAVNLAGIKSPEIKRGFELSVPGYLHPANIVDGLLRLVKTAKSPLKNRARIRLHIHTSEVMGRVILLDKELLNPGEECLAQFLLEHPIVAEREDRFIIRCYSPAYTIGGGKIIRCSNTRLKRFKEETLKSLKIFSSGNLSGMVEHIYLNNGHGIITAHEVSMLVNIHPSSAEDIIAELIKKGFLVKSDIDGKGVVFHRNVISSLKEKIVHVLKVFHKENPLKMGIEEAHLKILLGKDTHPSLITVSLSALKNERVIKCIDNKLSLMGFQIEVSGQDKSTADRLEEFFKKGGGTPPSLEEARAKFGVSGSTIIPMLVEQKRLVEVGNSLYFHATVLNTVKGIIKEYVDKHGSISVAEFRDLTKTSRKFAIPLLEYFDAIHFTKRRGDVRIIL